MKSYRSWAVLAVLAIVAMALGSAGLAVIDQSGYSTVSLQEAPQVPLHGPPVITAASDQAGQLFSAHLNVTGHCHLSNAPISGAGLEGRIQPTRTWSGEVGH